jgi:hypothetical protein
MASSFASSWASRFAVELSAFYLERVRSRLRRKTACGSTAQVRGVDARKADVTVLG